MTVMIYWIFAFFTYVYLCYALTTVLDIPVMAGCYFLALVAAALWPASLLVAIPSHLYLRSRRGK